VAAIAITAPAAPHTTTDHLQLKISQIAILT
jgi:hypothetical protein